MREFDKKSTRNNVFIPVEDSDKLRWYTDGIRGLLRKIEVGNCDDELKESIKAVYDLLSHMTPDHVVVVHP